MINTLLIIGYLSSLAILATYLPPVLYNWWKDFTNPDKEE